MTKQHDLHAYDYVNHPYGDVCDALLADPRALFIQATATTPRPGQPAGAELRGQLGPVAVGAEIAVEVVSIEESVGPSGRRATRIGVEWKAVHRPGLFPTMRATLNVYALSPTETQLDLEGTYAPPFGVLGEVIDAITMSRLAVDTITNFVRAVAAHLRERLAVAGVRAS